MTIRDFVANKPGKFFRWYNPSYPEYADGSEQGALAFFNDILNLLPDNIKKLFTFKV